MSFGFSIGDFLALAKLTKQVSGRIKNSPSHVKDAQDDLANISNSIQKMEASRLNGISDPVERDRVQALFKTCQDLVKESTAALAKYEDMIPVNKSTTIGARVDRLIKRVKYNENDTTRARDRIHQALSRLAAELQDMDSKLLQHVSSVVERTAVDVGDTKAGVERTEQGVERTERGVERIERGVDRTERGVERTEIGVGELRTGVERTERGVERTERGVGEVRTGVERTERGVERTEIGVGELRTGVERLHMREDLKEQTLERRNILDWICPSKIDYADPQDALTITRQIDTGEWLLESDEFQDWIRADRATLLCSGMPGVGKTMLTSFVVSNLLERYSNNSRTGFAYIYCQFSRRQQQTPEYLMLSILRQLLEQHNIMPDEVSSLYRTRKGINRLTNKEIFTLLTVVFNRFDKMVLVIDALDELSSTDRIRLVSQVLAIQQNFNINVYATSRYTMEIAQKASNATQVDILAREHDLRHCLDMRLRCGPLLSNNLDLLELAITKILDVAKGIFLLAVRYADYLADLDLLRDLKKALKDLKPVSDPYDYFYTGAMQRMQARKTGSINVALITIRWLFFARRPLRQKELLHALAFSEDDPQAEDIPMVSDVLSMCAGLVVVDEVHNTVSLFHKSLDDFLEKSHAKFLPLGDQSIGTTCVEYLSLDKFADGPRIRPEPDSLHSACQAPDWARYAYGDLLVHYPLYEYAQRHWHDHIRGSASETADIVTNFLADPNKLSASCQTLESLTPRTTGLHLAVRFLLDRSLERHLELYKPDPNGKDNFGRTPLSYAAELNNVAAIDHLVNAGAILDFEDDHNPRPWVKSVAHTPLSWAAFKGNLAACEALLGRGADVNYQDSRDRSALSYAAEGGSESVTRFLLEHGALVDPEDSARRTPLCWATATGSNEVATLLLAHKANIDHADKENVTPLLSAARAGSEPMIAFLVARGADVNSMSYANDTPLTRAVEAKLIESVRLLLSAGADVNRGTNPAHPLTLAISNGSKEIVRLLISAGGHVNQTDRAGVLPLAHAAKNGWTDILQLLLEHGAEPDQSSTSSQSILNYAVRSGVIESVELLLRHGATINRPCGFSPYCELIHQALGMDSRYGGWRSFDEDMLRLLLAKGADPNPLVNWETWRHNPLDPPLLFALQNLPPEDASTERAIRLLLENGAKTDQVTRKGLSVTACAERHSKKVQDLLRQQKVQ